MLWWHLLDDYNASELFQPNLNLMVNLLKVQYEVGESPACSEYQHTVMPFFLRSTLSLPSNQ